MDIKDSGKLMLNLSMYNITDSAVAVLKGLGTTGRSFRVQLSGGV